MTWETRVPAGPGARRRPRRGRSPRTGQCDPGQARVLRAPTREPARLPAAASRAAGGLLRGYHFLREVTQWHAAGTLLCHPTVFTPHLGGGGRPSRCVSLSGPGANAALPVWESHCDDEPGHRREWSRGPREGWGGTPSEAGAGGRGVAVGGQRGAMWTPRGPWAVSSGQLEAPETAVVQSSGRGKHGVPGAGEGEHACMSVCPCERTWVRLVHVIPDLFPHCPRWWSGAQGAVGPHGARRSWGEGMLSVGSPGNAGWPDALVVSGSLGVRTLSRASGRGVAASVNCSAVQPRRALGTCMLSATLSGQGQGPKPGAGLQSPWRGSWPPRHGTEGLSPHVPENYQVDPPLPSKAEHPALLLEVEGTSCRGCAHRRGRWPVASTVRGPPATHGGSTGLRGGARAASPRGGPSTQAAGRGARGGVGTPAGKSEVGGARRSGRGFQMLQDAGK